MAPGVLLDEGGIPVSGKNTVIAAVTSSRGPTHSTQPNNEPASPMSYLLTRTLRSELPKPVRADGNYWYFTDDRGTWSIFDSSGGAAVSNIGHHDRRVYDAMDKHRETGLFNVPSLSFYTDASKDLAEWLIKSTNNMMRQVVFYNSGSEANEAAKKLAIQYHARDKENPQLSRRLFIARDRSYHGATLGALEVSGHKARKDLYRSILPGTTSLVSPCYTYRDLNEGQTEKEYVAALAAELKNRILHLGPENVAGFFMEPVVGAALGCVPAVKGYLQAMKDVCDEYGVLLIFDEVMCGMGRTGYLHAWQEENVAPDIQLVGKGLAGGYADISGMLINQKLHDALKSGSGSFNHGHTFQNFAPHCATALAVQKIIEEDHLLDNVREKGPILRERLEGCLGNHPNIGEIRGPRNGLFLGVEFVADRETKEPFASNIAMMMHEKGLSREYGLYVYPGSGTMNGYLGDHIIIAPAFNITYEDVETIVDRVHKLIVDFFDELEFSA